MSEKIQLVIVSVSLITALVGLVASIVGRKHVIEVQSPPHTNTSVTGLIEPTSPQVPRVAWYNNTMWLTLSVLLFWPIGLYGLYKSSAITARAKKFTFIILGIFLFYYAIHTEIEALKNQVISTKSTSDEALSTARQAAADAKEANSKLDRMFKKIFQP
jgi:hypothetical protein